MLSYTDPNIFFWIAESVGDAAAVSPNSIKTLYTSALSAFFIIGKPVYVMVLKVYLKVFLKKPC